MPRVASRFGVNVAGALPFEESGAFGRWVSTSRLVITDGERWRLLAVSTLVTAQQMRQGECGIPPATRIDFLGKALLSTEYQPITRRSENPKAQRLGSD